MSDHKRTFIIAEVHSVHDEAAFERYLAEVFPLVMAYGGRFLTRGGDVRTLEGEEFRGGVAIIEFVDRNSAEAFWFSSDYASVAELRHRSATSRVYLVEGISNETQS